MSKDFSTRISRMPSDKLRKIVLNYTDYQKEFVELAEEELMSRGCPITPEEQAEINSKKKALEEEIKDDENFRQFVEELDYNVVEDQDAPKLYSREMILLFSALFSEIFGGLLLSYNLLKLNKTRHIPVVMIVSIVMSVLFVLLLIHLKNDNNSLRFIFAMNGVFSIFIYARLWWVYVGKETKYRKKSILFPFIISALIYFPILIHYFF